jgi:hypothetical protein
MPKFSQFSSKFRQIRQLVLQKIGLNSYDMVALAESLKNMTSLRELDISHNKLDATMLTTFLSKMTPMN